jgi:hypothetical protein
MPRSRRPPHSPGQVDLDLEDRIVRLRKQQQFVLTFNKNLSETSR